MDFPEGDGTVEKEAKRGQSGGGGLQITRIYGTGGPTNIRGRGTDLSSKNVYGSM